MLSPLEMKPLERLIRLRWLASATALGVLTVGVMVHRELSLRPAFAVAVLIPLSNVVHRALARRSVAARRLLLVQFGADLILLTALLGCLGGIDGPVLPLYLFHALLATVLLEKKDAIAMAVSAVLLAAGLAALQVAGAPFPLRGIAFASALIRTGRPVAAMSPYVVAQVVTFSLVIVVAIVLLLPVVGEAREQRAQLQVAEAHARAQLAALEQLLDNTGTMMTVVDRDHRLVWFNRVARERLPALKIGEVRVCFDPAEPMGGPEPPECPSCHALRTGKSWTGDFSMAVPGQKPRIFRVYATPITDDESGPVDRVVELIMDVTEERENEIKLVEARKTAGIAQLAAGVAHEMGTPLASIGAGLRSLRRGWEQWAQKDEPEGRRFGQILEDLAAQTTRCQRVTESLLGYSRQLRSHLEPTELDRVIRGAIEDLGSRRNLQGTEIVYASAGASVPQVRCDPDHLRLVLVNVLTNAFDAVRHANRTKGRVRVDVKVPESAGFAEIQVIDNGVGMSPEIMEKAFDPFFTTKQVGEGSGLGLSVSRGLLEDMGGSLTLRSEPGRGAMAVLRLATEAAAASGEDQHA